MVTSVSRSGPDDETPGGTDTGVSAERGSSAASAPGSVEGGATPPKPAAKRAPAKSAAAKRAPARSAAAKSATAKSAAAKSTTAKTTTAKTTTAKSPRSTAQSETSPDGGAKRATTRTTKPRASAAVAAERVTENVEIGPAETPAAVEGAPAKPAAGDAAKTVAKSKPAARKPTARSAAAKKPAARSTTNAPASEAPEPAPEPTPESKRTAASRAASSTAAAKRGAAAKGARTPSVSLAQAKERAADARRTAAARQRVAAAMTTDTTEAERAPRKSESSVAAGSAGAAVASAAAATSVPAQPVVETETPQVERNAAPPVTEIPLAEPDAAPGSPVAPGAGAPVAHSVDAEPEAVASPIGGTPVAETPSVEPAVEETGVEETPAAATPAPETSVVAADVEPPAGESTTVAAPIATGDPERTVGDERGVAVIPVGAAQQAAPRKKRTLRVARPAPAQSNRVLAIEGLVKRYGDTTAVDAIALDVKAGSFYGIVGPNGAGKTTTLSMVTGLLRPDAGTVRINDIDVWKDPRAAKRATGVLPDRLRLFDRLTGSELLYYSGSLRGLDHRTVLDRSADLAAAFGLEDALDRLVADYSAGMTKKIALACAMIHSPRLLVLDEPFESVDPVSAANLTDILERYVAGGGTVLLSSHSMDLIERVCDSAAIIVGGRVLASGALDEVRQGQTLEDRFVELAGGRKAAEGLEWLHSFSD